MAGLLSRNDRSIIGALAEWWRQWMRARSDSSELEFCGPDQVERMAQDLGISASDLRELASYGPDQADLLRHRMVALGLDPVALARSDGPVLRDLQRLCTMCRNHARCARDLASTDPVSEDWQDYCPNAAMLKMFNTLRICTDAYK